LKRVGGGGKRGGCLWDTKKPRIFILEGPPRGKPTPGCKDAKKKKKKGGGSGGFLTPNKGGKLVG